MQILGLKDMYFDTVIVFVTISSPLFRFTLAILCFETFQSTVCFRQFIVEFNPASIGLIEFSVYSCSCMYIPLKRHLITQALISFFQWKASIVLLPAVGKPIGRIFAVNCNFCDNFNKAISSHGQLQVRQLIRKPGWAKISAISTSSMKLDDNLLSPIQGNLLRGIEKKTIRK